MPTLTSQVLTLTPTGAVALFPTETSDPNAFSITAEIDQSASNEEIINILFSRWLDHLMSKKVSAYWRIDDYKIEKIYES